MIDQSAVRKLRDRLDGDVLQPDDDGYDAARASWNGRFDHRPALIARCRGAGDVATAIEFARDQDLPLSVASTGHEYAGHSICDDGVVIDLSLMKDIRIDADRRVATVEPGVTWAELDAATQEHGLATTGATVSTVGIAGYTLGGGTGYLARRHGLSIDNLAAVEMVTADGRRVRASDDENANLFWGVRGGSGNFGVVTSFEFRLHDVGPDVAFAQAFHLHSDARDVLRYYSDFARGAPDDITCYAFFLNVPPVEPFSPEYHGQVAIALIACHCGDTAAGLAALQPLQEFGEPILSSVQTVAYTALQQSFDAGMPEGLRWFSKAHYLAALTDAAIDTACAHTASLPAPFTIAYFEPMGGAAGRVAADATAFPHRDAEFSLHIMPGWEDAADDAGNMDWARRFHQAMTPHVTGGVYVNLLGEDEQERVPEAYGANHGRLRALKKKWDPDNVFRINHNIEPA